VLPEGLAEALGELGAAQAPVHVREGEPADTIGDDYPGAALCALQAQTPGGERLVQVAPARRSREGRAGLRPGPLRERLPAGPPRLLVGTLREVGRGERRLPRPVEAMLGLDLMDRLVGFHEVALGVPGPPVLPYPVDHDMDMLPLRVPVGHDHGL